MDPNLPALLAQAARAVAEVRQAATTSARAAAAANVPGWQGGAARRHMLELSQLQTVTNRALAAIGALESGLGNAAATAGRIVEAEARAAREAEAAARAAAGQVQGPPWPGAGYPTY
jgi:hypothetical protein